jgi:hypothetical protein
MVECLRVVSAASCLPLPSALHCAAQWFNDSEPEVLAACKSALQLLQVIQACIAT